MIPKLNPLFVPFGVYEDCEKVLTAGTFFPTMLTGPSGIGKTEMVEHICAKHSRNFFRVNITFQTDEDDLIGGLRLLNSQTVFEKGPVIRSMEAGGILLLDEIDLASPMLIMCLQSILEGKGYLIKKTGEWVAAKAGFQIFSTANTKGIGDNSGSFVGTQILNESFLERFPLTFECDYPDRDIETKILTILAKSCKIKNSSTFIETLIAFANDVRTSYKNGSVENTISTRRLAHIVRAFSIYNDERKAVEYCLNRFDTHTKNGFMDIFDIKWAEYRDKNNENDSMDTMTKIRTNAWNAW